MTDNAPKLTLKVIAQRIHAHLKRIENDPKLNPYDKPHGIRPYYMAGAHAAGSRVAVRYVCYQGTTNLTRDEAIRYLAFLDAGNVGKRFHQR